MRAREVGGPEIGADAGGGGGRPFVGAVERAALPGRPASWAKLELRAWEPCEPRAGPGGGPFLPPRCWGGSPGGPGRGEEVGAWG